MAAVPSISRAAAMLLPTRKGFLPVRAPQPDEHCHRPFRKFPTIISFNAASNRSAAVAKVVTTIESHGSKNLFCASRRIFRAVAGRHFSGRIFFQLGRNHAPRLTSLGAKKKKLSLRPASAHTRTRTSPMK